MKVLLADDHEIVRTGMKQILLSSDYEMEIEEVENGLELVNAISAKSFDLIISDISMPIKNGIEAIKEIRAQKITTPILVLSINNEEQYAKHALKSGANGYISKDAAGAELLLAVNTVLKGGNYISSQMAEMLALNSNQNGKAVHEYLSERELEIFMMISKGITLSNIAKKLNIKVSTVSTYRIRIMEKMKMKTNAELVKYVVENKLM